jgi:hypothetical protein
MKRRLLNWLYRWVDDRGRLPRWVFWIWKDAHWCPEMDGLLIIDNTYDCFCGHAKQAMVTCQRCDEVVERRWADYQNVCLDCIPPQDFDHDPLF